MPIMDHVTTLHVQVKPGQCTFDTASHEQQTSGFTPTLREESCQTNVILQYKLLAAILSAFCIVIQQS